METPDEPSPSESARAEHESAEAGQAQVAARRRQDMRQTRERLSKIAADIADTETKVAATLTGLAEQARRGEREDDARRLEGEAAAARRAVEHEQLGRAAGRSRRRPSRCGGTRRHGGPRLAARGRRPLRSGTGRPCAGTRRFAGATKRPRTGTSRPWAAP